MNKKKVSDEVDEKLVLTPLDRVGESRQGSIGISYTKLVDIIGFIENVEDDPYKVEASWGFSDQHGREGFVWCYKEGKKWCTDWSCCGDEELLEELFDSRYRASKW